MATSSITHNFVIKGKHRVEAFAKALEASFNTEIPEQPEPGGTIATPAESRDLLKKWMARHQDNENA